MTGLYRIARINKGGRGQIIYDPAGKACALLAGNGGDGGARAKTGLYAVPIASHNRTDRHTCVGNDVDPSYTVYERAPRVAVPVIAPDSAKKGQSGRRFGEDGDRAFTLTAGDRPDAYDWYRIRRLMPIETERLQGFPDGFTAEGESGQISDTQRYHMMGNAVSVPVVAHILNLMKEAQPVEGTT